MKAFFKYVLATITGIIITFFLLFVVFASIIGVLITSSTSSNEVTVANNSLLVMNMKEAITERTLPNPFEDLDIPIPGLYVAKSMGLDDVLKKIEDAKSDSRIKGILLDLSTIQAGRSSLEDIRNALLDFKDSGKFIISYGEVYSQSAYYLATVSDEIYVNPEGSIDFKGLALETMFYKGALEKLGIEMQIVKVGTFKSAVEPFIQEKMSDANRVQMSSVLNDMYDDMIQNISESRNISPDTLRYIADELLARNPQEAIEHGLIDGAIYKDELLDLLKDKLSIEESKDIPVVALSKYKSNAPTVSRVGKERIAVLYATGEINSGEGSDESIGSERISRELRKLRKDDKVKAVVFRINSPGGSALASDIIWREVKLLKEVKPIIVSMGDVAASGGYYIAAAADSIFAQSNTITGSIGVFGTIPNFQKLYNDKLGLTFDGVKTSKHADMMSGSFDKPLSAEEMRILQLEVEKVYNTFISRVAEGRNLSLEEVDEIGQGRVWTGNQAKELGLVDEIGSLERAIEAAAKAASLEEYYTVSYPSLKQPFNSLFGQGTEQIKTWITSLYLDENFAYISNLKENFKNNEIQARLPFTLSIH